MPLNCPIRLIPFQPPDACLTCPQYDAEQEVCRWFFPPRPLTEILDNDERLLRLERLYFELKEVVNAQRA